MPFYEVLCYVRLFEETIGGMGHGERSEDVLLAVFF